MSVATIVVGPCGDVLTRREMPQNFRLRWTARRKAEVVIAVETGILSLNEACERYIISPEEFFTWKNDYAHEGMESLRCNALKRQRDAADADGAKLRHS
jgi:hypothetical protein